MFRRYMFDKKPRIDARPENSEATQAGMRNVHRDMRGNVIGGVTAEGQALGTKARSWQTPPSGIDRRIGLGSSQGSAGNPATPGLDRLATMQSSAINRRKRAWNGNQTMPATGNVLNSRINLHKKMKAAGPGGITEDMRKQAKSLGIKDQSFDRVASEIPANQTDYGMASAGEKKPRAWRAPMI